jgi:hypothetical protein
MLFKEDAQKDFLDYRLMSKYKSGLLIYSKVETIDTYFNILTLNFIINDD